jgi:hypothetical protein
VVVRQGVLDQDANIGQEVAGWLANSQQIGGEQGQILGRIAHVTALVLRAAKDQAATADRAILAVGGVDEAANRNRLASYSAPNRQRIGRDYSPEEDVMGARSRTQSERLLGVAHGSNARHAGALAEATVLIDVVSVLLTASLGSK